MMRLSACAILVLAAGGAAVADVIDQNNPDQDVYMVGSDTSGYLSQTFKQTANSISGAGVYILGGSDTITLSVFNADPYYGGTLVGSATGSASGSGGWLDVFWTPQAITAGQEYFLQIKGQTGGAQLAGTYFADKYLDGSLRYQGFDYAPYGYDMTFRTWAPVPTPGSAAVLGLGGLVASRRRRA